MDNQIYPESTIEKFLYENLFFKDVKLKKYYDQGNVGKFRNHISKYHSDKSFEKVVYVLITDSIRDIIINTIGDLTGFLNASGDLIVSGGEAFNLYVDYKNRIITSDIDAKFVPRFPMNKKYFGKLQAVKLMLWNKLGELSKQLNLRVKKRIMEAQTKNLKLFRFLGLSFKKNGPYVKRRYSLIKKKKLSNNQKPSEGDVFIDVELFALDLQVRHFVIGDGKVDDVNIGGILDIPFMRPKEFGYEVALNKKKGITYREIKSGKLINDKRIFVASKEFLIEDIYLMQKLRLRPEKKEKDRQRLVKLAQLVDKRIKSSQSMESVFKNIIKQIRTPSKGKPKSTKIEIKKATKVDPYKYKKYTTKPSENRISKQIVYGLKPVIKGTKVNGYMKSSGSQRFNTNTKKWVNAKNPYYVKNEYQLRPINGSSIPKNINQTKTLYGYKPRRNNWVPKSIIEKAADIPYVGLKK